MKCSTFERVIVGFINLLSPTLYGSWVQSINKHYSMGSIFQKNYMFERHLCTWYAFDVTLQQFKHFLFNDDVNQYFFEKHKLYGYKL